MRTRELLRKFSFFKDMLYYKKIEIDFYDEIVADTLKYLKEQKSDIYNRTIQATYYVLDLDEFKKNCPKLDLAFARYDLVCNFAVAFVMYNSSHAKIHVDNYNNNARINIPILNTIGTYTRFYTGGSFKQIRNPDTNVPSLALASVTNLKQVDKVEIDSPTVIRVNEPHDVVMNSSYAPRITLTLGFDRDPIFLLDETL